MTSGWQLMASAPRTSAEGRRLSDSPRRLISIGPAGRPGPRQRARLSAGAVLRELRACPAPGAVRAVRMRSRAEIRSRVRVSLLETLVPGRDPVGSSAVLHADSHAPGARCAGQRRQPWDVVGRGAPRPGWGA